MFFQLSTILINRSFLDRKEPKSSPVWQRSLTGPSGRLAGLVWPPDRLRLSEKIRKFNDSLTFPLKRDETREHSTLK
ncbi:MAG: hypothetical protein EH225_07735 [Calditrichaeota bacterium]|nr:hypothetical protein [Calditrichota bacterium]RQW02967.1 MAG: hypothetical protein EH225_07735 [Calditrichota bacterium]